MSIQFVGAGLILRTNPAAYIIHVLSNKTNGCVDRHCLCLHVAALVSFGSFQRGIIVPQKPPAFGWWNVTESKARPAPRDSVRSRPDEAREINAFGDSTDRLAIHQPLAVN
jgi:hypothetical protein